jgi:hypothetical protein
MFGIPKMEENGIDIVDWDAQIYRVYSIKWFTDLITTNKNGLVNPSKWEDPFENFFLQNQCVASDGTIVSLESLSNSWYGQCWTRNSDSDAMWRIYSSNKEGVRVSTTIRKLFSSLYDHNDKFSNLKYMIGSVEYLERTKIEQFLSNTTFTELAMGGQPHKFAKTLCIKRSEFSHENEVRLLFQDVENNVGKNGVASFPFNHDMILDDVALDPRLSPADFQNVKSRLVKLGCKLPIIQSDLYQITPTTIRLD